MYFELTEYFEESHVYLKVLWWHVFYILNDATSNRHILVQGIWYIFLTRGEEVDRRQTSSFFGSIAEDVGRRVVKVWNSQGNGTVLPNIIRIEFDLIFDIFEFWNPLSNEIKLEALNSLLIVYILSTVEEYDWIRLFFQYDVFKGIHYWFYRVVKIEVVYGNIARHVVRWRNFLELLSACLTKPFYDITFIHGFSTWENKV